MTRIRQHTLSPGWYVGRVLTYVPVAQSTGTAPPASRTVLSIVTAAGLLARGGRVDVVGSPSCRASTARPAPSNVSPVMPTRFSHVSSASTGRSVVKFCW